MSTHHSSNKRVFKLREALSLSQKEFAKKLGISQGALSQLESGKSSFSLETIKRISSVLGVNCNWLVNGEGDVFLENRGKGALGPEEQFLDKIGGNLIPLIREEAHAGYIKNCTDLDYIKSLDVYRIPGFESGDYRLFEIEGDSMVPTIFPREIVVAEFSEHWNEIENGSLGIIITEDGIVAKRIYFNEESQETIILKSDNAKYKTYTVPFGSAMEIWLIRAKITNVFAFDNSSHAHRLQTLESDLNELKQQVSRLTAAEATPLPSKAGKTRSKSSAKRPAAGKKKPAPQRKRN